MKDNKLTLLECFTKVAFYINTLITKDTAAFATDKQKYLCYYSAKQLN
jgi:hypothetical protein